MDSWKYRPARDQNVPASARFSSVRREHGLIGAASCALRWGLIRASLRLMHRLRVEGRDLLPHTTPFVLVGNHASHLDALVAASVLPLSVNHRVYPIGAGDTFFKYKTTAVFSGMFLNVLPMVRDGSGGGPLLALRERLLEGESGYLLFPEGTRSRSGQMGRFKAGVGMLVAGTSVPVVPFYLSGTHAAWPPAQRLPRPHRVSMRIGTPQVFPDAENHRGGWRQIADSLETAVRGLSH